MRKNYSIDELYAGAWQNAISNVGVMYGLSKNDDWKKIETMAQQTKVRFDVNGDIINETKESSLWGGQDISIDEIYVDTDTNGEKFVGIVFTFDEEANDYFETDYKSLGFDTLEAFNDYMHPCLGIRYYNDSEVWKAFQLWSERPEWFPWTLSEEERQYIDDTVRNLKNVLDAAYHDWEEEQETEEEETIKRKEWEKETEERYRKSTIEEMDNAMDALVGVALRLDKMDKTKESETVREMIGTIENMIHSMQKTF